VLSPVASSSAVPVEDTASAPSVAPTVTEKAIASIHSDGLTSSLPVKDAGFYRERWQLLISTWQFSSIQISKMPTSIAVSLFTGYANSIALSPTSPERSVSKTLVDKN
jgi:hypothetical protein